jgi:hypothetical protein
MRRAVDGGLLAREDMGVEGDSMLSLTLIKCNFVKPAKGLRFHPIRTNCPASAQGITSRRWTSAAGRSWAARRSPPAPST